MVIRADIRLAPIGSSSCASKHETALVTNVVFREIELHVLQFNLSRGLSENLVFETSGKLCCAFV